MSTPRILFVDDEPDILESLADVWGLDYEVATATGGEAGLEQVERWQPHVVVSDMRMPGMDGARFLAQVKTRAPDVVRVLLTGHSDVGAAIRAVNEGGISHFLTKPCTHDEMARVLAEATAQYRATIDARSQTSIEIATLTSQLTQAERLAELGTISATLGHEMANSLVLMSSAVSAIEEDLAQQKAPDPDTVHLLVNGKNRLLAQANAALTLARAPTNPPATMPAVVDLRELIEELAALLRASGVAKRAKLSLGLGPQPLLVVMNRTELEQIVINLVKNAADAIPSGRRGSIVIEARAVDTYVELAIRDNGGGIAPEHLPKIFEPYFTTKPVGVGTGLGLPLVRRLVEAAGGTVTVTSELGVGTAFVLELPRAEPRRSPRRESTAPWSPG